MPAQNVLIEDYEKLQMQYVICESFERCVNAVSNAQNRCKSCCSNLNSLPLQQVMRCAQ